MSVQRRTSKAAKSRQTRETANSRSERSAPSIKRSRSGIASAEGDHEPEPAGDELDVVYQGLLQSARDPRRRRSLASLKHALDHLVTMKTREWTFAQVARTVRSLGYQGPLEQSILNDAKYKSLIEAYKRVHAPPLGTSEDEGERFVLSIENEAVAKRVHDLLRTNRKLTSTLDMLHASYARLAPLTPEALLAHARNVPTAAQDAAPPVPVISQEEAQVLARFVTEGPSLVDCEWDVTGALVSKGGREVAGMGFRQVLERFASMALTDRSQPTSDVSGNPKTGLLGPGGTRRRRLGSSPD